MHLQQDEADAQIEMPRDIGGLIKRFKNDPVFGRLFLFIVDDLCGVHRQSFALPDNPKFKNGRRWPGLVLWNTAHAPMKDPDPLPEPRPKTAAGKQRRRATKS